MANNNSKASLIAGQGQRTRKTSRTGYDVDSVVKAAMPDLEPVNEQKPQISGKSYSERFHNEPARETKNRRVSLLMKPEVYQLISQKAREEGAKSFNDFVNNIMLSYATGELKFKD